MERWSFDTAGWLSDVAEQTQHSIADVAALTSSVSSQGLSLQAMHDAAAAAGSRLDTHSTSTAESSRSSVDGGASAGSSSKAAAGLEPSDGIATAVAAGVADASDVTLVVLQADATSVEAAQRQTVRSAAVVPEVGSTAVSPEHSGQPPSPKRPDIIECCSRLQPLSIPDASGPVFNSSSSSSTPRAGTPQAGGVSRGIASSAQCNASSAECRSRLQPVSVHDPSSPMFTSNSSYHQLGGMSSGNAATVESCSRLQPVDLPDITSPVFSSMHSTPRTMPPSAGSLLSRHGGSLSHHADWANPLYSSGLDSPLNSGYVFGISSPSASQRTSAAGTPVLRTAAALRASDDEVEVPNGPIYHGDALFGGANLVSNALFSTDSCDMTNNAVFSINSSEMPPGSSSPLAQSNLQSSERPGQQQSAHSEIEAHGGLPRSPWRSGSSAGCPNMPSWANAPAAQVASASSAQQHAAQRAHAPRPAATSAAVSKASPTASTPMVQAGHSASQGGSRAPSKRADSSPRGSAKPQQRPTGTAHTSRTHAPVQLGQQPAR
eukprot:GHUV01006373.1.p2 GENE.GHUV01006373.1~~GHUV01006373.1.p2  ORF type:complete len:548 (+),score=208.18 GHUV01006373.1:4363-6006(+)